MPNKTIRNISIVPRECELCNSSVTEELWSNQEIVHTKNYIWCFQVHVVICKKCGFIYSSPVFDEKELLEYYQDNYLGTSHQSIDYSVKNRINFLKKHNFNKNTFLEIGSNRKTIFHKKLEQIFDEVSYIEPNQNVDSEFNSVNNIKLRNIDVISHYFVLEHIPKIKFFFQNCHQILNDDGIMICEVPDIKFYNDIGISSLLLHEHVNHFSLKTLIQIAEKTGFKCIYYSYKLCSRDFGFVMSFKKNKISNKSTYEYSLINKNIVVQSINKINQYFKKLNSLYYSIYDKCSKGQIVTIWITNTQTLHFFKNKALIEDNIVVVDSDPAKSNFLQMYNIPVYQPIDVIEHIKRSNLLVIFSKVHAQDIMKFIKIKFEKTFSTNQIIIVDYI